MMADRLTTLAYTTPGRTAPGAAAYPGNDPEHEATLLRRAQAREAQRQRRRAQQAAALHQAAPALFDAYGIAGVSIAEIASHAGVPVGAARALYRRPAALAADIVTSTLYELADIAQAMADPALRLPLADAIAALRGRMQPAAAAHRVHRACAAGLAPYQRTAIDTAEAELHRALAAALRHLLPAATRPADAAGTLLALLRQSVLDAAPLSPAAIVAAVTAAAGTAAAAVAAAGRAASTPRTAPPGPRPQAHAPRPAHPDPAGLPPPFAQPARHHPPAHAPPAVAA